MGVICRAPHSPVGEVGRQGVLLIFRIFQFSWSCCKFALQSWPGVSWYVHCVRLCPPPRQASRASSSFSVFFFKTPEISFRFLTASKVQELYRRAPSVSSELSKT